MKRSALAVSVLTLFALACADAPTGTTPDGSLSAVAGDQDWIVASQGDAFSASFRADIEQLGGTVVSEMPEVGLAVVRGSGQSFREALGKISGVGSIAEDFQVQLAPDNSGAQSMDADVAGDVSAAGFGDAESFRRIQWAPDAISAPAAWDAGVRGAGARVAVLDGGIYSAHIDIAPNLDVARSRSFVPNQAYNADVGTFWHGTHVAGIVAAKGNGVGTLGMAPDATIIGVKVLHNGSGSFSWILNGMIYAATPIASGGAGAHIINMSLGAGYFRQGKDNAQLSSIIGRVSMYARQQGVLVVAALGNNGLDLDHTANIVFFPAQGPGVLAVSATGPMGWGLPGFTGSLDRPASYTNYGQSAVNLAAPGGDSALPGNALCSKPRQPSGAIVQPCWVFDLVMAPCRGQSASISTYCWASGTSMAAPAVSGVAALVISKYGNVGAVELERRLRASADDLGKPGQDDYYGAGRVNAWRAVQ